MTSEDSPAKPDFGAFFFEKLHSFLHENPDRCDVTFSVGPQKVEVKASRLILEAASAEMRRLFQEKWNQTVIHEGEGIPLPDFEPEAFRMFLKLLPLDPMSDEFAKSLGLPTNLIFSMIDVCKNFEIKELKASLEILAAEYLSKFATFITTAEFLDLSPQVLKTILSTDCIHLDEVFIFEGVYKWAEHQCAKRNVEINGTNIRQVLGDCLFEIRFPLMSVDNFNKIVRPKNILTSDEKLAVFEYITLDDKDVKVWKEFDATGFVFKTDKRCGTVPASARSSLYSINNNEAYPPMRSTWSTAQLFSQCYISNTLTFICDGTWKTENTFSFSQNVEVLGVEFFGPVDDDAEYEARAVPYHGIVPKMMIHGIEYGTTTSWIPCGFVNTTVRARRRKRFQVFFTQPIFVQSNTSWRVDFSLKGPVTQSWDIKKYLPKSRIHAGVSVTFSNASQQLSAILFNKQ